MPPKGAKSPRTKSPKSAKPGGATWESLLSSVSANQDNWITFVCFLIPDGSINQIYVDLIEKAMQNGVRRRFDFISKRDLLEAIKSLGKASKTAAKSVSTNATVASLTNSSFFAAYEYAKSILDTGGDIDDQLWAKLLKCRILDLKKEVQNRTTLKTSSTPAGSMPGKGEKPKSPGGKKSPKPTAAAKKQTPGLQPSAADTHIEKSTGVKTRDQIINETKYIDDEPNDGPNQYVFLSGFYSTGLLSALDNNGVHIDTITNVSCESLNETKYLFDEMIQRDRQEQTLKADVLKDILTPEQIAQQNERNDQILNNFWKTLMPLLDNAPDRSTLQDIIVTTLKVSNDDVPNSWTNTEQRIKLAQILYNSIVENSFRLNIRKRQFNTFNQQMKVVTIPTVEEKTIESISDAKIYNEITTILPPESISIPLILHGILEQVNAHSANVNKNTSSQQDDVGRYLRDKLMSLSIGKEQQKEIENLVPKSPFSKATGSGPLMVYYDDDMKQRLATLNRLAILDPIKVEHNFIISHSRLVSLPELSSKKVDDSDSRERQTRLNQFLQFCTDEELLLSDVDHILKQFVFECMPLNITTITDNSTEQQTSRPSSAECNSHEDEQLRFERRLSTLVDEENKQSMSAQPIIWDDPFELLTTNEQTGRIGISADTLPSSPTSQSSKGSILRMRTQSPKRPESDSVYTVRFDVNNPDNNLYQQMSHIMPPVGGANVDGTIQNITQYHKRNLNDWNFAEHFEPDVFAQVFEQALFTHSNINVYYNRRDNTHMIILSLPVPEGKTIGYENTSKKLFSDVGFRNFLDEISYEIVDWLRDEEAKYQADILAQEVQTYVRQTTPTPDTLKAATTAIEGAGKKGKAATGKKTSPVRSPSVSSDSGHSSDEEKAIRDDYIHPTSLKAWKQKKDKEVQEQEQQAKPKRPPSGTRSPKGKSPRPPEKAAKPPTPREKSPKGAKTKRPTSATPSEKAAGVKTPQESNEPIERFIGYNLGNRLLSAQCNTSHLLLPDGCFVRTRIDTLKRGSTCVSTSLYRNKSSYTIQLINPNKVSNIDNQPSSVERNNTDETTKPTDDNHPTATTEKRVAEYGVFTAILNSGMILSCSNYDTKPPKVEIPPPEPPVPEIQIEEKIEDKKKEAPGKGKKKGKAIEAETPPVEKPPAEPQFEPEPFQRLTISIPTGLVVTYYPETFLGVKPTETNQLHKLVVKQYYPYQSKGFHTCEQSRLTAYEETSRIIDAEGHVMIFKRDGEVTILQPDGGIFMKTIVHQNEPEIEVSAESSQDTKKENKIDIKGKKKSDAKHETDVSTIVEEVKQPVYQWKCITADGQLFIQNSTNQEYEKIDQLRLILETNPKTNEQVIHREDKVIIVFRSDGSRIVSFADGTRITTYEAVENKNNSPTNQDTDDRNNSMLGFRKIPHVKIEALGYATVAFNCQTTDCRTVFNDGSSIDVFANGTYSIFESDGEKFDINDNGDILLDFQQSIYAKRIQELLSNIEPSKCILSQNGDLIFDAVDYEQTQYCVETSGETYSKETDQQHMTRTLPLEMHVPRFFIVHEDGSGTELLRFKDLYSYLRTMDLDPSTAVVREPLLSNPKVTGATVMRPFQDEVHRRWLTSFDDDSVVPPSLRNYTSATAMTRSYSSMSGSNNSSTNNLNSQDNAIVRQTGKNNQQQFKSTTLTTGLSNQQPLLEMPKALDYRNFMEFPRLQDDVRIKLFTSLKSYIDFVKNRADYHTKLLPHDNRSRYEKEKANKIWKNVRPQGTTKDDLTLLYLKTVHPDRQKTTTTTATRQSVVPLSKKFNLDHLHDELQQEKFNRQLKNDIKKGITMPYFKSEWGMAYIQQQQQQTENILARESKSAELIKSSNFNQNLIRSPPNSPTDQQNRLSQMRKSQPTRSVSTEVEDNKTIGGSGEHDQEGIYRPVKQFISPKGYIQYNTFGTKRAHPLKIPTGLKGTRPNAQPHSRFLDMEEPVMVRPNNASIGTAVLNNRPLRERRGCELFPDRIDFGILKEGVTYGAEIEIKNVGIDACRFRIRQPPLGTGLRVVFQPGLLAAGIRRPIMIELYAIIKQNQNQSQQQQQQQQSQGLYQLDQSIEIITETDIMHFPIRAKIASEEQFDIMFVNKDETAGMSKSIRLLARKTSNSNDWFANTNENSMIPTNE